MFNLEKSPFCLWKSCSAYFLLIVSASFLASCVSNDDDVSKRAGELLKQHKYADAQRLFQENVKRQEERWKATIAVSKSHTLESSVARKSEEEQAKRLAVAYNNLAISYYGAGKYSEAENAYEQAIRTYRKYFGKENQFVLDCVNSLAACYFKQGKLFEAERFYLEEINIQKMLLKPDSLSLATTANNLAAIYQKLGDHENAERYFQWALYLCEHSKHTAREKDELADILNNLALFYEKTGNYSDARDMVQKALDLEDTMTGTEASIDRVRSLLVLGGLEKGFDADASESHYKEAIKIVDTTLKDRPDIACDALKKYAELLLAERKFDEAYPVFKRAIAAAELAHGLAHPSVAEILSDFALLYRRTGRYEEA